MMSHTPMQVPCPGFPANLLFPDVEPHELAHEEAAERRRGVAPPEQAWRRVRGSEMLQPAG